MNFPLSGFDIFTNIIKYETQVLIKSLIDWFYIRSRTLYDPFKPSIAPDEVSSGFSSGWYWWFQFSDSFTFHSRDWMEGSSTSFHYLFDSEALVGLLEIIVQSNMTAVSVISNSKRFFWGTIFVCPFSLARISFIPKKIGHLLETRNLVPCSIQ